MTALKAMYEFHSQLNCDDFTWLVLVTTTM